MVGNEKGVSLVETIIALAIAGILAAVVIFGRDSTRARMQFGQSMDQWVLSLSQAASESSATVGNTDVASSTAGANAGGNHIFGKYVTLRNNDNNMTVDTVLSTTSVSGGLETEVITAIGNSPTAGSADTYSVKLPWGVKPSLAATTYVLFLQSSVGAVPQVFVSTTAIGVGTAQTSLGTPLGPDANINMTDGVNNGRITIDASGNVTWKTI